MISCRASSVPAHSFGMSPVLSKFESPEPSAHVDAGMAKKLAERVEEYLNEHCLFDEPRRINPDSILVSIWNRLGAPPNCKHLHHGVLRSFKVNAFDKTRPAIGILVEIKSEEGIRKLLEHNHRLLPACLDSCLLA